MIFSPIQGHFFRRFWQNFSENESHVGSIFRTSSEQPRVGRQEYYPRGLHSTYIQLLKIIDQKYLLFGVDESYPSLIMNPD